MANLPAIWYEDSEIQWRYRAPGYAVYGYVFYKPEKLQYDFEWQARVMLRARKDGSVIIGRAPTLELAQEIVEVLCKCTYTCEKREQEAINENR
jgi:hypothetical protein